MPKIAIRSLLGLLVLVTFAVPARADLVEVVMRDGAVFDGVLVREDRNEVVIRLAHGTVGVSRSDIESVNRLGPAPAPKPSENRLPGWEVVFDRVLRHPEARSIRQIPATVINEGVLRHVPYMSHRFGSVELNLFGDPEAPACVEVGIFKGRPMTDEAKRACVRLMCEILAHEEDRRVVASLNLTGPDLQRARGFAFEITPPDAEDAYGGWWISVYDEAALEVARANADELRAVTTSNRGSSAGERDHLDWRADDYAHARPRRAPRPSVPQRAETPPAPSTESSAVDSGSGGGSVYVRGYYRKDGTYVRPHTRRAPRRR